MKHLYKFSLLLLAILLPATALAHDFEVDGIYYNINGNEAIVTYKTKTSQYSNDYTGNVTIPSSVTYNGTTYSVTSIGDWAFDCCNGLTSIDIPNSVTSIGDGAFNICENLASISLGNSITSIGHAAFFECFVLTSIDIPNSVTTIGNNAFEHCYSLKSITIPNSVTSIGDYAFEGCWRMTNVSIGNSVTSIGNNAFAMCSGLTSIDIPNSVTTIGEGAFDMCSGLTSVHISDLETWCRITFGPNANPLFFAHHLFLNGDEIKDLVIPSSISSISDFAFEGCSGLTSVTIPNSVISIGGSAFYGCSSLTGVQITDLDAWCRILFSSYANPLEYAHHLFLNGEEIKNLVIPSTISSISNFAFVGCSGLTSLEIHNSVTAIGYASFANCSGLTSVIIGNTVTSLGEFAFADCSGLTSITIPSSVTSIGSDAFYGCGGLTEIYSLAMTPPIVESNTFYGCYSALLFVPADAYEMYKRADYWKLFNIYCIGAVTPGSIFEVDGIYYRALNTSEASVIANNEVESYYIGDVVVPDSVTYEDQTFTVTGIENNAFDGCFELTSVVIPNSVETIGEQAFQGCTGLTSVTIGSGVTAIGAKAFNYCNALETVKCIGTVPPVMASTDCFSTAAYNRATLLVPRQFVDAYTAADYWYKFAHIDGWGSAGRGDIDGDGEVSIRDVTTMIDAILTGEHEGVYFESADLNNNGRLDIGDVTTIIDMLLNGE